MFFPFFITSPATLTQLISLVFLASILSLWRIGCTFKSFGIALHIIFDGLVTSVASLSARPLRRNDSDSGLLSRRALLRHQTRPAQQLQILRILRVRFDTTWRWSLRATARDCRRCGRFLATQRWKSEVVVLRRILCAMISLNLLQILVEFWRCRRCRCDGAANNRRRRSALFATALNLSQLQVQLVHQTDNAWFLQGERKREWSSDGRVFSRAPVYFYEIM